VLPAHQRLTGPQTAEPTKRRMRALKALANGESQRLRMLVLSVTDSPGGVERRDGWVVDSSCDPVGDRLGNPSPLRLVPSVFRKS